MNARNVRRARRIAALVPLLALALLFGHQAAPATGQRAPALPRDLPRAEAQALYQYLSGPGGYTTWPMWPGKEGFYMGSPAHGAWLKTYVNPIALAALRDDMLRFPDGAIIVKENYTMDRQLHSITVMYERPDDNPEEPPYFWMKYLPNGKIVASGHVDGCIDCHIYAPGGDWVFTTGLAE